MTSANSLDSSVNIADCQNSVDCQRMKDLLVNMLDSLGNISVTMVNSWGKPASIQAMMANKRVRLVRTRGLPACSSAMLANNWETWESMSVMLASIADWLGNTMDSWANSSVKLVYIVAAKAANKSSVDGTMDSWMDAMSLLSNSLRPVNNVDLPVNNAAAKLDSGWSASSQD